MTHGRVGCDRKAASRSCERRLRRHARLRGQGMARAAGPSRPGLRSVRADRSLSRPRQIPPLARCALRRHLLAYPRRCREEGWVPHGHTALERLTRCTLPVRARAVVASILRRRLGRMDMLMALAVSIGVLIAVWTYIAVGVVAQLSVWAAIVAWGCFFAAGGKMQGFQKTVAANVSGLIYAFIALQLLGLLGGSSAVLAILVGVIAFLMVLQSRIALLSFIPGAFIGAAVTVGSKHDTATDYVMTAVSLILGGLLGYVSEALAGAVAKKA